jgi:hypothetical protein
MIARKRAALHAKVLEYWRTAKANYVRRGGGPAK